MAFIARRLVSTNKRRYQDDGYDLDLSYITSNIIAMGFPCDGVSRLYRNPLGQVVRLLEARHGGRYKVYNLCIERGYDATAFGGRVVRLPMYDGQAPPLSLLLALCRDAAAWLAADPAHVVAVHCKAGKGRTGAAVCALLLALEPQLSPASLPSVLALWARQRTRDGKGITIASQRRFVEYFHGLLLLARNAHPAAGARAPLPPTGAGPGTASGHDSADGHNGPNPKPNPNGAGMATDTPAAAAAAGARPAAPHPDDSANHYLANPNGTDSTAGTQAAAAAACARLAALGAVLPLPVRAARLLRLRLRGLPPALVRDCTVSVWSRPPGHYAAHAVCHVHTRPAGAPGCLYGASVAGSGAASACGTSPGGATWSMCKSRSGSGGGVEQVELTVDLTGLSPPPPPPAPLLLPYFTPSPVSPGTAAPSSPTKGAAATPCGSLIYDAPPSTASRVEPGVLDPASDRSTGAPGVQQRSAHPETSAGGGGGGPVLYGDFKVQLFRGCVPEPDADVFKGRATQFSCWLASAFLDPDPDPTDPDPSKDAGPRVGVLHLGRGQLDKISKPLRRWRGDVSLMIEYELCCA